MSSSRFISIKGLDKAEVLKALFDVALPKGYGWLQAQPTPITIEDACQAIAARGQLLKFDYVEGRVIKVNLTGDVIDTELFDRDNGQGAAARAIDAIANPAQKGGNREQHN